MWSRCGALLLSSLALSSHLARRSPPLVAAHPPTLYVKHGGGFGAAAPLDNDNYDYCLLIYLLIFFIQRRCRAELATVLDVECRRMFGDEGRRASREVRRKARCSVR